MARLIIYCSEKASEYKVAYIKWVQRLKKNSTGASNISTYKSQTMRQWQIGKHVPLWEWLPFLNSSHLGMQVKFFKKNPVSKLNVTSLNFCTLRSNLS